MGGSDPESLNPKFLGTVAVGFGFLRFMIYGFSSFGFRYSVKSRVDRSPLVRNVGTWNLCKRAACAPRLVP